LIRKDLRNLSLKGRLVDEIRKLSIRIIPHLRDNHILVARKVKTFEEMQHSSPKVVSDLEDWTSQRERFGNSNYRK